MNPVQTFKTEAMQARQLFWLGKGAHTHRTGYLIMKTIKQSLNIHNKGRKTAIAMEVSELKMMQLRDQRSFVL